MEIPSPEIPKTGRRFVIPDIHGCPKSLLALLEQIDPLENDQVFFLGDYVNKGPESIQVLDILISLTQKPNYYFIRGNHDQMMLEHLTGKTVLDSDKQKKLNVTAFNDLPDHKPYIGFLENLKYFLNLDTFLLVHAGFNFKGDPYHDYASMMNIVGFPYDLEMANHKTIVHGHLPQTLETIESRIKNQEKILPLDNGCVYLNQRPGHGHLLAFELDTRTLFKQIKLD